MRQAFDYGRNNRRKVIIFGSNFLFKDLMSEAHSVRLFYKTGYYVNLGNGIFSCQDDPRLLVTARDAYLQARTVIDSRHLLIAKRLKFLDLSNPASKALIDADPYYRPNDYQLRRVHLEYH